MNICFFTDIAVLGGGELWVLNAARVLRTAGHGVSVACPHLSALFGGCLESGIEVHGYYHPDLAPFHEPLYYFLRRVEVDVLYCTVIGSFCECRVLEPLIERINRERPDRPAILVLKTGLPPMSGLTPEYYGLGAGPSVRRLHVV